MACSMVPGALKDSKTAISLKGASQKGEEMEEEGSKHLKLFFEESIRTINGMESAKYDSKTGGKKSSIMPVTRSSAKSSTWVTLDLPASR